MLLLLILYPFAELYAWYVFIDHYSFLDAFLFALSTGFVGFIIMTMQGRSTVMAMQQSLVAGKIPEFRVLHHTATLLGGILIAVPGILAKIVGVILVLPGTRHIAVFWFRWFIAGKIASGAIRVFAANGFTGGFAQRKNPQNMRDVVDIKPQSIEHQDKKTQS